MFGHRYCICSRSVDDDDASCARCVPVNRVDSRAMASDHAQKRSGGNRLGTETPVSGDDSTCSGEWSAHDFKVRSGGLKYAQSCVPQQSNARFTDWLRYDTIGHRSNTSGGSRQNRDTMAAAMAKSVISMCSSGLWLPLSLRTNTMPVGIPELAKTAASCPAPQGITFVAIADSCAAFRRPAMIFGFISPGSLLVSGPRSN